MPRFKLVPFVLLASVLICARFAAAQQWEGPVRGSWARDGEPQPGDVVLADGGGAAEIVVAEDAGSVIRRAAEFLAGDIEKITGQRPAIVPRPSGERPFIWITALGEHADLA